MPAVAQIIEVAVPSPLYRSFDYKLPEGVSIPTPGTRVLVSFGRQRLVGIVLSHKTHSDFAGNKLKTIEEILDSRPVFDTHLLQLLNWAAHYYHHPIGETLTTALPVLLRNVGKPTTTRVYHWQLTEFGFAQPDTGMKRATRQLQVLALLRAQPQGITRNALPVPLSVLKALEEKGWIEYRAVNLQQRIPMSATIGSAPKLSSQQECAVEKVRNNGNNFTPYLLEGVTGSGKTEVYLRLIAPQLQAGKQVLVLVPEIGLTPQLVERFQQRFGLNIPVLHSGLNDTQRLQAWQQAADGNALLILGTRSAVFTPLTNPGMIIVDEEHDASLKQQDGLRYSARDLAVWRAHQLDIPIVLGTATPSLESLHNVQQGRYTHLHLPDRAGGAAHPHMHLMDLRNQSMHGLLSAALINIAQRHLQAGGQILLFLNRRGFAPVLLCHACGWVAECHRCDARLTLHQKRGELRCHHCGNRRRIDAFCPDCGSSELLGIGEGTERVEQALNTLFPDRRVLRIDRDSTRRKGALSEALEDASSGRADVLLGTQMLAKGHHFPNVTLVAVLDADQGLFSTDFRASERMAQLIIQVAGRAGRADKPGEVVIQTHHPEHPLLLQLVREGYPAFADTALAERRETSLPPYASMALLRAEATAEALPKAFLEQACLLAEPLAGNSVQLWGPVAAPMERRAGRYRAQLVLQSAQRVKLQSLLKQWVPQLESLKDSRKVRWSVDVDPIDTY
ncbi:Helicase PriA essential for oriC/DnaA-independent DNA replication [hydrothermal vent metagenome]|uniref:DNA 3'-5' helicase n=1 Tax=hydrothermal vent metagenome TaxID=652676 RepID=A0A3B0YMJ2_9ZZZZ